MISIANEKCNGCGLCARTCLYGGVIVENKMASFTSLCTECGACAEICKPRAISLSGKKESIKNNIDGYSGIWVIAEQRGGHVQKVTKELLGKAAELARTRNCEVTAVILGHELNGAADELIKYGADRVYCSNADFLERYRTIPYERIISHLISEKKPEVILFGATSIGRDLAPRLANRFRTGLTADCTSLEITPEGELLQTRPAFGGNIMATISTPNHRPQMATVRPGVMKPKFSENRKGEKITIEVRREDADDLVEILKIIKKEKEENSLESAEVIVSGGRGLGDGKKFKLIEDLARTLSGEVGASRGAVELGWMPQTRQIGQTGKTVRPKIYIACGIDRKSVV